MKQFGKRVRTAGMLLLTAAVLTGCGSSAGKSFYETGKQEYETDMIYQNASSVYAVEEAAAAEEPAEASGSSTVGETPEIIDTSRKLIKTVCMNVETEEYDALLSNVERRIEELGGYIENLSENQDRYGYSGSLRYASITARIPQDRLDGFVTEVSEDSNVISRNESVDDVTLDYVDLESHKKALLTERDRLLELLEKAETMEDIIAIESRLSEVRYQLESMESRLRTFDNKINYSTVYLEIREVERLTPPVEETAWDKIRTGFAESVYQVLRGMRNAGIGFLIHIPYFVVWAVIIGILVVIARAIYKLCRRKISKKQQKQQAVQTQAQAVQTPVVQEEAQKKHESQL